MRGVRFKKSTKGRRVRKMFVPLVYNITTVIDPSPNGTTARPKPFARYSTSSCTLHPYSLGSGTWLTRNVQSADWPKRLIFDLRTIEIGVKATRKRLCSPARRFQTIVADEPNRTTTLQYCTHNYALVRCNIVAECRGKPRTARIRFSASTTNFPKVTWKPWFIVVRNTCSTRVHHALLGDVW